MDAKTDNDGLADLRELRDQMRPLERELKKLQAARDKKIAALGAYEKAKADRLATSSGLSVIDVVALVPHLGPQAPASRPATAASIAGPVGDRNGAEGAAQAIKEPAKSAAPDLGTPAPAAEAQEAEGQLEEPVSDTAAATEAEQVPTAPAPQPAGEASARELPSIPAGAEGDRWFRQESNLVSKPPNFQQAVRQMAFLDTATGVLVWSGGSTRLELERAGVAEILTAVYATVPAAIERIYVTGGDPWHRDAGRYEFLRDAVAAWLNGPLPEGWQVESSRGKDHQARHLVHPRNPVGRWQRGKDQHTERKRDKRWLWPLRPWRIFLSDSSGCGKQVTSRPRSPADTTTESGGGDQTAHELKCQHVSFNIKSAAEADRVGPGGAPFIEGDDAPRQASSSRRPTLSWSNAAITVAATSRGPRTCSVGPWP
ncbi:hypothetical protein GCM10022403_084170 [Streptomyces coacervatus]|uniref:Uncharacterized protein n=1 Tax=Streptomyces coacervatus TaxID=647381 RepID=A0ABP7J9U6_9ACTN|nr:hypothetical protein [Streptomyces coacervatus]MDF2273367.1 hypothetical protein [Streptomyces coacervatus]